MMILNLRQTVFEIEKIKKVVFVSMASVLIAALFQVGPVQASELELFDVIPASACSPVTDTDSNRLRLLHGKWLFKGSYSGQATLECPIATLASSGPAYISGYEVFFEDSDGADTAAKVTFRIGARFMEYNTFYSNVRTNSFYPIEMDGLYFIPTDIEIGPQFYYLRVTLYRDTAQEEAAFSGAYFFD